MPTNNLVRIAHAGGYNNPALNLNFVPDIAGAQQNALATQRMQQQNALAGKKLSTYDEDRSRALGMQQVDRQRTAYEFLKDMAPRLGGVDEYLAQRDSLIEQFGIPDQLLPDENLINQAAQANGWTPEQSFEAWKSKFVSEDIQRALISAGSKNQFSAPKEGVDQDGNPVVYQVGPNGELRVLKGVQPTPKKGMTVYDREGNPIVSMGGGPGQDLTKKTQGTIQQKIMDGSEQIARMEIIAGEYKPEYQELGTRFKAAWTGLKAKLGQGVEEEDRQQLVDFKKFQRKAIENINLYIKELTGAQMSEKEADRLRLAQPDPGEKWYSGDDPITFKTKMDDVLKYAKAAVARYRWYQSKNLSDKEIKKLIETGTAKRLEDIAERL
jgi:hypothetical protein